MAYGSLTVIPTGRTDAKAGHNDPVLVCGNGIAQRIKGTLGITGLSRSRVHIDSAVWHLDVGSSYPGAGEGPKGPAVRRLKGYVSWVQNVVRQFGLYPVWALGSLKGVVLSTRGPGQTNLWCSSCPAKGKGWVVMFGRDKR